MANAMYREINTPADALASARSCLKRRVDMGQERLADAIKELDCAEKDLAEANARLRAMDEFIARTLPGEAVSS